ncbi:toxin C-terminal domain-containing protein [Paenibacillus puldeungensis]|uniref:Toxin C-terminal domain-containing protein n=1 Tax=Paenibacillus puldeungensis TaxID=696536 RepID=A0ABW3RZW4_9BACL
MADKYYDFTILNQSGALVKQGEHNAVSYGVPAGGKIQVKTTSVYPIVFAAPYRVFELAEAQEYVFEELQHRQHLFVNKASGESGYYRFVAPESGRYRFAAWTTTVEASRSKNTLEFRKAFKGNEQPDIHYLDGQRSDAASTQYRQQFSYDEASGWNVPVQVTESYLQGGTESQPLTATYKYNDQGLVLSENWSTGQESVYEYATSTAPYFWTLPSQVQTKIGEGQKRVELTQYNQQGSVSQSAVRENSANGKLLAQTDVEYDTYGNVATAKIKDDKRTNTVNYLYQSPYGKHLLTNQSVLVHSVDGTSSESQQKFAYTAAGDVLTTEDAAGDVTTYSYDALGRLTRTKYSDQTSTTMQYDDVQSTITTTGPEGIVTLEKYNPLGLLTKQIVDDAIFQYTYDDEGNMEQGIDAEQNITKYVYDGFGRLTNTIYADGSKDETSYDMIGRTVTYTDPASVKNRQKLDLLGNTLAVEEWRNGAYAPLEQTTYDLAGNAISVTDGKGQQTQYHYDALGRNISVIDPEQRATDYTYSLAGNLIKIQYPDKTYIEKEYNETGNLIRQVNEARLVEAFFYDSRGNLTKSLDHASQFTEYQYNSDNLLTMIKAPDQQINYTYDAMGRRTGMTDTTGNTKYTYDSTDGSLSVITYPDGTQINYTYNKQLRTGYTLTDASGKTTSVSYTMDKMNRVGALDVRQNTAGAMKSALAAAAPAAGRMTFDYKANGLLERKLSGNGPSMTYTYDGYDLTGIKLEPGSAAISQKAQKATVNSDSAAGESSDSSIKASDNSKKSMNKSTEQSATATEATYGLTRQFSAVAGYEFTYQYDPNKNMISRTQNGAADTFTYDPLNRIQAESGQGNSKKYTYDERGNLLNVEGRKLRGLSNADFTFDSLNRLTKVKGEDGKEISYSYNGDGLLYERVEGEKRTRYYYDEEAKLIAEANVTAGKPNLTYTYIYDLNGRLWSRVDQATGEVQYYQFNGHGDVVGLTDSQGKQLNTYTYDIWGNPETTEETVPNVFRYAGEYWDSTTKLQYLRARWYDPNAGRFVSKDSYEGSIDNPLSLNRYSYVENNPLMYTDPSGNFKFKPYDVQEITSLLDDARVKSKFSKKNKYYQVYKDFIWDRYNFESFMDENRYNYLYGLVTGTSAYKNSAGNASWARDQLVDAYFESKEAEYVAAFALGMSGGIGGRYTGSKSGVKGTGKATPSGNRLKLNLQQFGGMTTKEATAAAKKLGYTKTNFTSHGQPVFKKGNKYITPDVDGHNGGLWKMADSVKNLGSKSTRMGTYDENLTRIGD